MREFQQKKKIKRRIYSKITVIILGIILAFVIQGTWKVYQKEKESRANLARVSAQLQALNNRSSTLSENIARLKTEQGVEDEIRSKYQVAKAGEEVLVIVDKNSATTSTSTDSTISRWWKNFLHLFRKK